jgi:multimeric flavodoxin WrbA
MKIAIINGSPKNRGSISGLIARALKERLDGVAECVVNNVANETHGDILQTIRGSDAIVFIFPLYVDGIPSHLLRLLDGECGKIAESAPGATVYAIVNNGFYEGWQNVTALSMMRNFAARAGLKWGRGVGVGAGPIIYSATIGRGPLKKLGVALDALAKDIVERAAADDYTFEPHFPRFIYKIIAHHTWRRAARKNGVRI